MKITKQEFESYVELQVKGLTNMLDLRYVSDYTGLNEKQIMYIQKNYGKLHKELLKWKEKLSLEH